MAPFITDLLVVIIWDIYVGVCYLHTCYDVNGSIDAVMCHI